MSDVAGGKLCAELPQDVHFTCSVLPRTPSNLVSDIDLFRKTTPQKEYKGRLQCSPGQIIIILE